MNMPGSDSNWMQTLTGAKIRITTPGADTDNRLTIIDFIEPANSAPPVFTRHEFIEVFCVIQGTLCFQFLDEPACQLSAGEQITCPSYKPHSFWNQTASRVHIQLVCSPAGLDQFFVESDALLQSLTNANDNADTERQRLRTRYGLEHVGKPPPRIKL